MKKNIFTLQEIISIVMSMVEELETIEIYGQSLEEEINFSKPIVIKLETLNKEDYIDLINKVSSIAEEVYSYKSGELNELNFLHSEISILAKERLKEYLEE